MRIQRTELAVYNARAVDLLKRWQEHRIPCGDIDAVAGPQPDSMAALLGYEAEAIPFGLVDTPFIVEGFVDECREHRSICGIHAFLFGSEGFGISLCFGVSAANATTKAAPTPTTTTAISTTSKPEFSFEAIGRAPHAAAHKDSPAVRRECQSGICRRKFRRRRSKRPARRGRVPC